MGTVPLGVVAWSMVREGGSEWTRLLVAASVWLLMPYVCFLLTALLGARLLRLPAASAPLVAAGTLVGLLFAGLTIAWVASELGAPDGALWVAPCGAFIGGVGGALISGERRMARFAGLGLNGSEGG
jgi:hypothetical protein